MRKIFIYFLLLNLFQTLLLYSIIGPAPNLDLLYTTDPKLISYYFVVIEGSSVETFILKFLISYLLNALFVSLLITNFSKKHIEYFSKIRMSISFYKIFIIFIAILLIFFPRIFIREFLISFIFTEVSYISIVVSIC